MINSIKYRLLWSVIATVLLALVINSVLSHYIARHEVNEVFDAELLTIARIIKGVIDQPDIQNYAKNIGKALDETISINEPMPTTLQVYEKKILLQVWNHDGSELTFRSASSPEFALAPLEKGFYYQTKNHQDWVVYVDKLPRSNSWLLVAEIPVARAELSDSLFNMFIFSGLLALILCSFIANTVINYGLAKLDELNWMIRGRTMNNLQPIHFDPMPNELKPVVEEMNLLFNRLHNGIDKERRFVADAAHELRTPLAVMKLRTQNLQKTADSSMQDELSKLSDSVTRSHRVVEQLLLLARLDDDAPNHIGEACDVNELCRRLLADSWGMAEEAGAELVLECSAPDQPLLLNINPTLFNIALRNLIDNAIRYGDKDNIITLSVTTDVEQIMIKVEDRGRGVSDADLNRLSERFYRAHGQDKPGAGLGLSIVQRIVETLRGDVKYEHRPGGGLSVTLTLSGMPQ